MKPTASVLISIADTELCEWLRTSLVEANLSADVLTATAPVLQALKTMEAGCLIADLTAPDLSVSELMACVKSLEAVVSVVFLAGESDIRLTIQAMREGAFDVVVRPVDPEDLVSRVLAGMAEAMRRSEANHLTRQARLLGELLSPREAELLRHLAFGKSTKIIAAELSIAESTVAHHREHLLKKMGAQNSADLGRRAVLAGLA